MCYYVCEVEHLNQKIERTIRKYPLGDKLLDDNQYRLMTFSTISFIINIVYAGYNCFLGVSDNSIWFINMSAYYTVLSIMRIYAVKKGRRKNIKESHIMIFTGIGLMLLSAVLAVSVFLTAVEDVSKAHHEIVMITIALYTTIKVTLAIVNMVKASKVKSLILITLRNISCADAAASIVSLQRSMFASFGDINGKDVYYMNIATGSVAFIIVLLMGIFMIFYKKKFKIKRVID